MRCEVARIARGGDLIFDGMNDDGGRSNFRQRSFYAAYHALGLLYGGQIQSARTDDSRVFVAHFPCDPFAQLFVFQAERFALAVAVSITEGRVIAGVAQEAIPGNAPAVVPQRAGKQRQCSDFIAQFGSDTQGKCRADTQAAQCNGGVSLLQCAKLGQRYFMPILPMGHGSGGIAMRKAISLDMGHAHGVTSLVQPLGQGLQFGGAALQPMQQQHCMFSACQGD